MENLIFTRLLYPYMDVIQSTYESFKLKNNFDETIYWISELYYSMFYNESHLLLYFMYFSFNIEFDTDFKLYSSIQEGQKKWLKSYNSKKLIHSHFFKSFHKIYNNKYINTYNDALIEHENSDNKSKLTVYKGKRPEFLQSYSKTFQNIIYSLHKTNKSNTWNYIEKYFEPQIKSNNMDTAYKELIYNINDFINSSNNEKCKKVNILLFQDIFQHFPNTEPQYYITLSKLIVLFIMSNNDLNKQTKFKKVALKEIDNNNYKQYYNYNDDLIVNLNCKTYRILSKLRKYDIILPSPRSLEETIDLRRNYYYHWVDYIAECPLWKNRLIECNAIICNNKITFPDIDSEELFYDRYNYEPDEQPASTTSMLLI